MTAPSASSLAKQLLGIMYRDIDRLWRIDDYLHGRHDDPYMPEKADAEYKLIAERSVSNWMPLLVGTPAQAMYVDGFRRGKEQPTVEPGEDAPILPEWDHWQNSRLDSRQAAIYRGALAYGHAFTVTEKRKGKVITRGLSALRTAALFEDPANDETPYAALTIVAWPAKTEKAKGTAILWTGKNRHEVTFTAVGEDQKITVSAGVKHGATECPVTRFAASVDLEGRTVGVIEPMIQLQNRINQTVFDLLIAQTYGSFKVRYATGMAPPIERDPETGEAVLDERGQPKPLDINLNAKRFMFGEDHEVRFGTLDGTPLDGYIASIDMSIRHLAAVSQTPPHHLLGQIANLSAEALTAAETALQRKIEEFRHSFGEAWERVFRLAAMLGEEIAAADDMHGEVIWRDMEQRSLAQAADALNKFSEGLGIPKRGLWHRVPQATSAEIKEWNRLADEEDPAGQLYSAGARRRSVGSIPNSVGNLDERLPA